MFSLHPASQFYFPRLISHISVNSILTTINLMKINFSYSVFIILYNLNQCLNFNNTKKKSFPQSETSFKTNSCHQILIVLAKSEKLAHLNSL